ncbi:hypothetical protein ACHAXT_009717 [Thalassiosira profunda]
MEPPGVRGSEARADQPPQPAPSGEDGDGASAQSAHSSSPRADQHPPQHDVSPVKDDGASAQSAHSPAPRKRKKHNDVRPLLPVLIVPGFMSSGLEIRKSMHEPWIGKRLWINLVSLGMGGHFDDDDAKRSKQRADASSDRRGDEESAENPDDEEEEEEDAHLARHKKKFLSHLSLTDDMVSEHPEIEVRAMEGLAGVDYLMPGAFTNHASYVFGPVIRALKKVGYEEGKNLAGAPYDWRLPPMELERRDEYFTKTMKMVEELYEANGMPVVLLCHSLGCKVGHYLLDFAHARDPGWCDKYVHTYMPVGAPHLGAPKSLRGLMTGDTMGLPFLSDREAISMARSFGSILWLIPSKLPYFAPSTVFVRREGAFQITIRSTIDVGPLLVNRLEKDKPEKLELMVKYGTEVLSTGFSAVEEGDKVIFEGKFTFCTGPDGPFAKRCCGCCCGCCVLRCACCPCCSDNTLILSLGEPGLNVAKKSKKGARMRRRVYSESDRLVWLKVVTCWYLIKWVLVLVGTFLYYATFRFWVLFGDCINRKSNRSTWLASSEPIPMAEFVGDSKGQDVEIELRGDWQKLRCRRKEMDIVPTVTANICWISPDAVVNDSAETQLAEPLDSRCRRIGTLSSVQDSMGWEYDESSGYGLLRKEENGTAISTVSKVYDADPLHPRMHTDPPPVKNIRAIYGVNVPTEVGAVYKRWQSVAERGREVKNLYKLDRHAKLDEIDGYELDDCIVMETKDTPQLIDGPSKFKSSAIAKEGKRCSGDGSVPYWSLQFCRTWSRTCNVEISEIEGAEHRAILADSRFHKILIGYVTAAGEEVASERV